MGNIRKSGQVNLAYVFVWVILLNVDCQVAAQASCKLTADSVIPWVTISSTTSLEYFFSGGTSCKATSWDNANSTCRGFGGNLAVPNSEAENKDIWEKAKTLNNPWIGIFRRPRNDTGKFLTVHEVRLTYEIWVDNEPNNYGGNQHCVHYWKKEGKWDDLECDANRDFICERPRNIQVSTRVVPSSTFVLTPVTTGGLSTSAQLTTTVSFPKAGIHFEDAKSVGSESVTAIVSVPTSAQVTATVSLLTSAQASITINPSKSAHASTTINPSKSAARASTTINPSKSAHTSARINQSKSAHASTTINPSKSAAHASTTINPSKSAHTSATINPSKSAHTSTTINPSKSAHASTTINPSKSAAHTSTRINPSKSAHTSARINQSKSAHASTTINPSKSAAHTSTTIKPSKSSAHASTTINPSKSARATTTISLPTSVEATTTARPSRNPNSHKIFELSKKHVNSNNVRNVSGEIKNLTSRNTLISDDISNTASLLEKIVKVSENDEEVANNVLETIDNVLNVGLDVIAQAQNQQNSSARILVLINNLLEDINLSKNESFKSFTLNNFAVEVSTYDPKSFSGVTFSGIIDNKRGPLRNESITKNTTDNAESSPQKSTSVHLPQTTVFRNNSSENISSPQTVIFVLYKETKLFYVNSSRLANSTKRLNSYVIAASINGQRKVSNLKEPVVLNFVNLKPGEKKNASCSYWDFSRLRWSDEGCEFKGVRDDGRITCHCNHLTNFAMLMDIYPDDGVPSEVLEIISYIGCSVSLLALLLTIITVLVYRDLRSKIPIQILLNFCISLSLTLVVFLSAAERSRTSSLASCRAAAIAMHYFILVVFMWTAVEAFNMYLLFVKIIPSYFSKFMLKCCLVAWGIPAVIVSITVGLVLDQYGHSKYCRLQGTPFLVSFLAPILVIVLGNSVAFVFILHSLLTSRNGISADRKVKGYVQARRGAAIFVLLGLSWVFGVFAVKDAKLPFQYLFCIFNSLQGLFVFVFYCVLQPSTRKKYRYILKKASNRTPNFAFTQTGTHDRVKSYATGTLTMSMTQSHSSSSIGSVGCHDEGNNQNAYVVAGTMTKYYSPRNSLGLPVVTAHLVDQSEKRVLEQKKEGITEQVV